MNEENNCRCYVEDTQCYYKVSEDADGNCPVTGAGGDKGNNKKKFTCVELEVYQLVFWT